MSHADGGLSRFHGGARGVPGALDRTLAEAPAPARPQPAARDGVWPACGKRGHGDPRCRPGRRGRQPPGG
ncbi:MAG: hypothetical protein JKP98_07430 [Rhodobacteraceae bacterium]|nr:hypothetical protein [Paracoccaceae bacterium]